LSDPSKMTSQEADFVERARAEGRRYGHDPWVFIRELGQNSRDAKASRIDVVAQSRENVDKISFADDGAGMTWQHARRYLFRLYASSKGEDALSAGKYGVGFWSVLLFEPTAIEVHSVCGKQAWAVRLAGDLKSWEKIRPVRRRRGTTVILERQATDDEEFRQHVEQAVQHYLSHLRTAGHRARPLVVTLGRRRMDRPFALESPGALAFCDGAVEGVVGFGERPAYRLYARGLPVRHGAYLEELEGKRRRQHDRVERRGAFPVYVINGNNLDVVLSRQTVVRDRRLQAAIRTARRRFDELIRRTLDKSVKRSLAGRACDGLAEVFRAILAAPLWVRWFTFFFAVLVLGISMGLLAAWVSGLSHGNEAGEATPARVVISPAVSGESYEGGAASPAAGNHEVRRLLSPSFSRESLGQISTGIVDKPETDPEWALTYDPPLPLMFRLQVLGKFDRSTGFAPAPAEGGYLKLPSATPDAQRVTIMVVHSGGPGKWIMPVPTGYQPLPGSASLGERRLKMRMRRGVALEIEVTPADLAEPGARVIEYRVIRRQASLFPVKGPAVVPRSASWPEEIELQLDAIARLERAERPAAAVALTRRLVGYDRSADVARLFARSEEKYWIGRVLAVGCGDCDIINGVLTLVLNRVGIAARLVVGFIGRDGGVQPGTHAWVEIEEGGLRALDASRPAAARDAIATARDAIATAPATATAAQDNTDFVAGQFMTGHSKVRRARLMIVAALAGLVLLMALVLLGWQARRTTRGVNITSDAAQRRKLLARLAEEALRRPGSWREIGALFNRKFVPCLGGSLISIRRMIKLSAEDLLFIGYPDSELARLAVSSGQVVLDASDADFSGLFATLGSVRSLEELEPLKPVKTGSGPEAELLTEVDRLLGAARVGARLSAAAGLDGDLHRDVDLVPVRFPRRSGWLRRYLALNTQHAWWQRLAAVYVRRPGVAVGMVIDRLAGESWLLKPRAARLRRMAAQRALGQST